MESNFKELLYTLRWMITSKWDDGDDYSSLAYDLVSKAIDKTGDQVYRNTLYTIRWYVESKWGTTENNQIDVYDLVTEVIDEDVHIDKDVTPNKYAVDDKDEEVEKDTSPTVALTGFKKIALVVGHNKNTGARSHKGDDEWTTRNEVAIATQKKLRNLGYTVEIFYRNKSLSYGSAMREHGRNIDKFGAKLAIELHFNSATAAATGMEMIVCSEYSEKVFEPFVEEFHKHYPDVPIRRGNGILLRKNGRGSGFCRAPKCPAGVWEPFFASNPSEYAKFDGKVDEEANALTKSIQVTLDKMS